MYVSFQIPERYTFDFILSYSTLLHEKYIFGIMFIWGSTVYNKCNKYILSNILISIFNSSVPNTVKLI